MNFRIIIGISGASGMPLAHALLTQLAHMPELETHLIISEGAQQVLQSESSHLPNTLMQLATHTHNAHAMSAGPASGSWQHQGMIICPCSMSSLAAIATGVGTNLIHRAADVCLKERRPLIIAPRETPLNSIHLRNMLTLSEAGATIMPFAPAFYTQNNCLQSLMQHFIGRILDQLHIPNQLCTRWQNNC